MRPPVGPGQPLRFRLARGQVVGDLDLIETGAAGHGVLVGDDVPPGAEPPAIALTAQLLRDGEAAPVGKDGKSTRIICTPASRSASSAGSASDGTSSDRPRPASSEGWFCNGV